VSTARFAIALHSGGAFVTNRDVAAVSAEHSFGKCIEKASRDHQPTPSLQQRVDQEE
jgi:hypothetical protein